MLPGDAIALPAGGGKVAACHRQPSQLRMLFNWQHFRVEPGHGESRRDIALMPSFEIEFTKP
jgi:hypothetical protein